VRAQFLLGPAGSGKTFRCLAEIRAALHANPAGLPLVFLAPKQATFQIERQLLTAVDSDSLSGFTRLHILSFERLAQFIFERLNLAPPKILSAEGRVMVLRALLSRHADDLKLFDKSARRPGFALELSSLLAELQQHQFTPAKLRALIKAKTLRAELKNKLLDLALLLEKYEGWLAEHELQDSNRLLEFATQALRAETPAKSSKLKIENLWLDGFAEMTPQELDFLAAITPFCTGATLAFCLETAAAAEGSWLSIWSAIGKTFQQCRARLANLPDCEISIVTLERTPPMNRFPENHALARLERNWAQPNQSPVAGSQDPEPAFRLIACQNPEAEAVFAAREVLRFIRAGNRLRECAVLVRNLDDYHKPLARTFHRYGLPFFLDRRESVAHHPLAELTRNALRTVAFDWQHDDWFAALKAGFCPANESDIDRLENAALEYGWRGKAWREPLPDEPLEQLREKIAPPFKHLSTQLTKSNFHPTGVQLAGFLRDLWQDLKVEMILERWTTDEETAMTGDQHSTIHTTVWEQMNSWLDNLILAFPQEALDLRDWLPILDAGLAGLTVGVIPPVLDEVLIGAIDRARNPDLKLALVLGVNESVFPAVPRAPTILTNSDRDELEQQNIALGPNIFDQLARERYLGYIACTRANENLAVTFSRQRGDGRAQNPSPFIAQFQKIFPGLRVQEFSVQRHWHDAESTNELILPLEKIVNRSEPAPPDDQTIKHWQKLLTLPALRSLADNLQQLHEPEPTEDLPPAVAEKLYGPVLKSSVSRLEQFAQCPFRFFVHSGLRANERKMFELDAHERGTFQHEILKTFHDQLVAENKRWRDLVPAEARERIAKIATELQPTHRGGLLNVDAQTRFDARILTTALQDFVGTLITWMRGQYEFDPVKAEFAFGQETAAPALEIDLGGGQRLALRGQIDRIDLCRAGDSTLAVVMDYKSSQRKLDPVLIAHGIQLQLLAYLTTVRRWPESVLGVGKIIPAGVFYVNLRGQQGNGDSRTEVLSNADESRRESYRHLGRFDSGALDKLDAASAADQFKFSRNKDGSISKNSKEALPRAEFQKLLDQVEDQLRMIGQNIFSGATQVDPYRKGSVTACDYCDYRPACRIDRWTHPFRVLRTEKATETVS
jgi:ATP-dependent helicase/nuclease subunit B